jgi:GR25 family glycosyltransferase involved in LPS biosynthesis
MVAEPYLSTLVTREPAVHGRQLKMTQEVYDMFANNQFQWKKSVIGCNLSHISVWSQIAKQETGSYFLVLEDDVRFVKGWQDRWANYVQHIPKDADLLYLGGVLPPNKPALPLASKPYNEYWSYIKPNTFFSPVAIPVFHFCAYSYILTRRGAQKLMDHLRDSETKSFTVSDHLLGHPSVGLQKYFTNPLLAHCFQEEDPAYLQSQFNELHREDTFDSDLWNNKDCFSEEELAPFKSAALRPFQSAALRPFQSAVEQPTVTQEEPPKNTVVMPPLQRTRSPVEPSSSKPTLRVYYMPAEHETAFYLYEKSWLEDMFQRPIEFISIYTSEIIDGGWYLVQRPHIDRLATFFVALEQRGLTFKVIHVSDEYLQDQVGFYSSPCCKAVIRSYLRKDIPMLPHILTIPLGYHHKYTGAVKPWLARDLIWSFHGTNWYNRQEQLATLTPFVPFSCNLQPSWNHPTATKERQYLSQMANSKFCPVMRGQNVETFRMYEALETGTLPITLVKDAYSDWIDEHLHLSTLYDWTNPQCLGQSVHLGQSVQQAVMARWATWKQNIKELIAQYV